jgi:hypothetical protein
MVHSVAHTAYIQRRTAGWLTNDELGRMWMGEHCPWGAGEDISEDSQCPDRDSNQAPPEYKPKALPCLPTTSSLTVLLKFLGVGWDWVHLARRPLTDLLYQPRMIDDDECGAGGGMRIGRGNVSTINPTWTDLGSSPGRRGRKSATNRLNYGTIFELNVTWKPCEYVEE